MQDALYFIAIIPPLEIAKEVEAFKIHAAEQFNSSRALRSPAHITIIPPFKWQPSSLKLIKTALRQFASLNRAFYLDLKHFDCFAPRVIFVDIVPNEALAKLQKELATQLETELDIAYNKNYGFHPHMTIAFKDLKKTIFPEAWAHYSTLEYQRSFNVEEITLLRHNGQIWEIESRFKLNI